MPALPAVLMPAPLEALMPVLGWLVLAIGLLALLRGLYEPRRLAVTRRVLAAERTAARSRRICVALISDLHAERLWIRGRQIAAELARTPVDIVCFTGDLAGDDRHARRAEPFLAELGTAVRAAGIPFLAVTGNHDGPQAVAVMRAAGVDVLCDEQRRLSLSDGTTVVVTGLADEPSDSRAGALLQPAGDIRIVLVHNPDAVLDLPEGGADFLLGGHFHGGQVYAPFQIEFRLLRSDRLPLMGHWRGPFRLRGYQGYISRGLGCVWLPLRFFSLPELAILELVVEGGENR